MNTTLSDKLSHLAPITLLYTVLAAGIIFFQSYLEQWGVDKRVLHGANTVLLLTASLSLFLMLLQTGKPGSQAILKSIYGGFIIRFLGIAMAAFIYIFLKKKNVNIPGLIGGAFFYVLYWVVEIRSARKQLKSTAPHA